MDDAEAEALAEHIAVNLSPARQLDVALGMLEKATDELDEVTAERDRLRAVVEHAVDALGQPTGPSPGVLMGTVSLLRAALKVTSSQLDVSPEVPRAAFEAEEESGRQAWRIAGELRDERDRLRAVVEALREYHRAVHAGEAPPEAAMAVIAAAVQLDVSGHMGGAAPEEAAPGPEVSPGQPIARPAPEDAGALTAEPPPVGGSE